METNQSVERIKNPKRVAAGKKGAEARKAKRDARDLQQLNVEPPVTESTEKLIVEDGDTNIVKEQVTQVTRDTDEIHMTSITTPSNNHVIKVYKNYIPICLVGVVGIGLFYMYCKKSDNVSQPAASVAVPVEKQTYDPFDF